MLTAAALLPAGPALAQPLKTMPGSPDPLLRVTPIERDRIRSEPTPGLDTRFQPGWRAVILWKQPRPDQSARLSVMLQLPTGLFERTTAWASELRFISLVLPSLYGSVVRGMRAAAGAGV